MESAGPGADRPFPNMPRLSELPRKHRRRVVVRAGIAPVLASALFTVAYFVLPYSHLSTGAEISGFVVGLVVVVVILGWEVRAVIRSRHPGLQALGALVLAIPLFWLLFATGYYLLSRNAPTDFSEHLSRLDALYFTVSTFGTVGYGDIAAKSEGARTLVMLQIIADLVLIGFGIRVLFGAVRVGVQRGPAVPTDPGD